MYKKLVAIFILSGAFFSIMATLPDKKPKAAKKSTAKKIIKKIVPVELEENPYFIVIDKSDYELKVYDDEGWFATYPVVFGGKDLGDKMKEGDRKTPNGTFKVLLKKINSKWGMELLLDYPNTACVQKFNDRKSQGLIPKNAKIGNGIAIHATRPAEEWTVDNFYNWTDGCISLKYSEMKDLYSYIPAGTPVTIQP